MSSAASGSQNNGGSYRPAAEAASATPRPADSALLERVLRQTLEICGPNEPIDAAEMRALREVAERHRGRPLELEPVAVELVAAAIDGICPTEKNSDLWRNISAQVARILMDDPSTFARMKSLWIRLGGVEQ
ncbi:MAG: hypothetical protein IT426_17660 [Pirellulales bacterium]|nr:hypothetical protein [Pirellulales bacterium]